MTTTALSTAAHHDPLHLDDITTLLSIRRSVAHKRAQRGTLPTPLTRNPHLTWDATTFWDWARDNAPDIDRAHRPLRHWEPFPCPQPRITHHGNTTLVVFTHPRGRIGYRMCVTGDDDTFPSPNDPDWDGVDVMAVHRPTIARLRDGFNVDVLTPTGSDRINTLPLSRLVGQPLPYWPSGLRGQDADSPALATEADHRLAEPTLTSGLHLLPEKHVLAEPGQQQIAYLRWTSYQEACNDIAYLRGGAGGATRGPIEHLALMAEPRPVPEATTPNWDSLNTTTVGDNPAVRAVIHGLSLAHVSGPDTRSLTSDGRATEPDPATATDHARHTDAVASFANGLHPISEADVTYAHQRMRHSRVRDDGFVRYLTHHAHPQIMAVSNGTRITYTPPTALSGADRGTPVDLVDPANPLVLIGDQWLPVPTPPDGSGVNAGYRGAGPMALLQALGALIGVTVPVDVTSVLAETSYPRHTTIGNVMSTRVPRVH